MNYRYLFKTLKMQAFHFVLRQKGRSKKYRLTLHSNTELITSLKAQAKSTEINEFTQLKNKLKYSY